MSPSRQPPSSGRRQQQERGRSYSSVLQNDPLQRVADILAPVDGILNVVVQLLPFHDLQRRSVSLEQLTDGGMVHVVANALQPMNLDQHILQLRKFARLSQPMHRIAQ